jgi:hypothetical protein
MKNAAMKIIIAAGFSSLLEERNGQPPFLLYNVMSWMAAVNTELHHYRGSLIIAMPPSRLSGQLVEESMEIEEVILLPAPISITTMPLTAPSLISVILPRN